MLSTESDDNYQANTGFDYEAWALTAKAKFGNNAVSAIYTTSETKNNLGATTSDTDGWAWLLSTTSASAPRCTLPAQLKTRTSVTAIRIRSRSV